jgi:hypothetical protein
MLKGYTAPNVPSLELSIPTLGQTCDGLVVCVHPMLTAKQTEPAASHIRPKGSTRNAAGSKAPKADISLQVRASARLYLYLP